MSVVVNDDENGCDNDDKIDDHYFYDHDFLLGWQ